MNDDLTTRLSRQLHEQADDWHAAPLTLDSVRGRAHSIRRTRRIMTGSVAAAAVAAVVVPTMVLLGADLDADRDIPPTGPSPTQVVEQASSPVDVPFLSGQTLTLPDGDEVQLPERYLGGSVLGDTVFGIRSDDSGNLVLDRLDEQRDVAETVPLDSGIVPNLEGDALAYVSQGTLTIRWEDGATDLGRVGPVQLVRLVGGPDCTLGADDCVVYYNDAETPRFLNNSGEGAAVSGEPLSVKDADDERRVAMLTEVTDEPGSCGRVFDQQSQAEAFSTCDYTLGRFSSDGSLLSATQSYEDGFGDAFHAILDSESGAELARYEPGQGGAVYSSVWEDADHLLVLSYEDGAWLVTRLGADGSTEVALPRVEGSQEEPAYVLLGATF